MTTSAPPAPPHDAPWSATARNLRTPSSASHVARAEWSLELRSRHLFGDAVLAHFLGLPRGPLTGVPSTAWFAVIHSVDVLRVVAAVETKIARGGPLHVVHRVRVRASERTLFARATIERDGEGRAIRLVGEMRELR